eukprot:TRINITY_DN7630_c0_g1_i1.p1 TRINITY_DN7630_c0_g1~~TRINITY_DN7630_c0_g1_i1.p1  ORF type:complete len:201 (+),score=45.11 TRINITY_DN7630_c0_g1_i1:142-744(+)
MKFKLCGNLDAPDWLLHEIDLLSKMSAVKMILLAYEVIKSIKGIQVDQEKVTYYTRRINRRSDQKAIVAALQFILKNAAKFNVSPEVTSEELQQLGLPRTHSKGLARVIVKEKDGLREQMRGESLRLNALSSLDWKVDFVLGSSVVEEVNEPEIQLKLNLNTGTAKEENIPVNFSLDKFRVFLAELKRARAVMSTIEGNQ